MGRRKKVALTPLQWELLCKLAEPGPDIKKTGLRPKKAYTRYGKKTVFDLKQMGLVGWYHPDGLETHLGLTTAGVLVVQECNKSSYEKAMSWLRQKILLTFFKVFRPR